MGSAGSVDTEKNASEAGARVTDGASHLEAGFVFIDECEVYLSDSSFESIEKSGQECKWIDLEWRDISNESKAQDPLYSGHCSHCYLVLSQTKNEHNTNKITLSHCGDEPRFDGKIEDSKPNEMLCTCENPRQQRSDASLLLGLALTCQETGNINIQSARIVLHKNSNNDGSQSIVSKPSPSLQKASIYISFGIPEVTPSQPTRSRRFMSRKPTNPTRRFMTTSLKSLPDATQLLLSFMRSDWEFAENILRRPERIWEENGRKKPRLRSIPFFPPRISLNEVYKRIGGAASVVDEDHDIETMNTGVNSGVCCLESLPNDVLIDNIAKYLRARSLDALRLTCKAMHYRLRSVVPGLKLRLYCHQIKSLTWMRLRETKQLTEKDFVINGNVPKLGTEHDAHRAASGGASVVLGLRDKSRSDVQNVTDIRISQHTGEEILFNDTDPFSRQFARGGLLCDDPGLGKTITVISLILQTLGLSTSPCEKNNKKQKKSEKISGDEGIFAEYWKEQVMPEFRSQELTKFINTFIRNNQDTDSFFSPNFYAYPDYYQIIKNPIFLVNIKDKILDDEYGDSFDAFQNDVMLCFRNEMQYHPHGSEMYLKAERMSKVFSKSVKQFQAKQVQLAKKSFGRASAKPDSAVAALVEQNEKIKLKSSLIPSFGTLLVVPSVLLEHWETQLQLHVDVSYCTKLVPIVFEYSGKAESGLEMEEIIVQCKIRKTHFPFVFIDKTGTKKLPSPDFLAMFSIVLTTNQRFTNEWKNGSFEEEMKRDAEKDDSNDLYEMYKTYAASEGACSLLKVDWLRLIVDEGHSMGRGNGNSAISFASWVEAERRWAMTGTPTRQTNAQSGLSSMINLMHYLKHDFFSRRKNGIADWQNLIARGWSRGMLSSFYRLCSLLRLLMVRHTKLDIEELKPPRYRNTTLQMSPEEVTTYNTLVCAVQSNLILTSMNGKTSGLQDSLLHRSQLKHAREAMRNIRLVCTGGTQVIPTLSDKNRKEFTEDISRCVECPRKIEEVMQYLSRAENEQLSPCACCGIMLTTLLVFPCGDLVCTECVNAERNCCVVCDKEFDVDIFQRLQPGMDYQWLHNVEEESKGKTNKQKQLKESEDSDSSIELPEDGAGMLAPVDETRIRRRTRRQGDGHKCEYCPKRGDGTCELCWKPHEHCNLLTKNGKCKVCHKSAEECPASETKPSYIINKFLELMELDRKHKEDRNRDASMVRPEFYYTSDERPLKVIVFSQFRKVLNTIGDRLLRRFGTACVAEYWGKYRKHELHKFTYEGNCFCMLLGKDGSEGLDLSFVTHIFFLEQVWDKALQQQAVSRAYRMGAKGSVEVETLIAANSVEETMLSFESMSESDRKLNLTIRATETTTKDKDFQRTKLHFLLKSLKLISNSFTSSFGGVKRDVSAIVEMNSSVEPYTKRLKIAKGRVRFE